VNERIDVDAIAKIAWPDGAFDRDYLKANAEVVSIIAKSNGALSQRNQSHCANDIIQLFDPLFPSYNANLIPYTNLIAAEGPCSNFKRNGYSKDTLLRFFNNTVFNKFASVKHILALGNPDHVKGDFFHYFATGEHSYTTADESHSYHILSKEITKICDTSTAKEMVEIAHYKLEIYNNSMHKKLDVTWLPTPDLMPINIQNKQMAEILYNVYLKSIQHLTLIHCAAGVGRTGAIILTFQILSNYNAIFSNTDIKEIGMRLKILLLEIRNARPALITTQDQFTSAIKCALYLHNNFLRK